MKAKNTHVAYDMFATLMQVDGRLAGEFEEFIENQKARLHAAHEGNARLQAENKRLRERIHELEEYLLNSDEAAYFRRLVAMYGGPMNDEHILNLIVPELPPQPPPLTDDPPDDGMLGGLHQWPHASRHESGAWKQPASS